MRDREFVYFVELTTAIAMANKAMLTLYMAGLPITVANAERAYLQWINPRTPHFHRLCTAINAQINEMIDTAGRIFPETSGSA